MPKLSLKAFGFPWRYKTVEDLRSSNANRLPIQHERRGAVAIGVIDDQTFDAARTLRNFGYKIDEIGDIKKLEEISKYPIILCDLMGVGLNFDDELQGASLIREIRLNYPAILIAAYSGAAAVSEPVRRAKHHADRFIKKDADKEQWTEHLDALVKDAMDAPLIWNRIRMGLVSENVSTRDIMRLEDAFVTSVLKEDGSIKQLKKIAISRKLSSSASNIIHSLAASAIFRAFTGF